MTRAARALLAIGLAVLGLAGPAFGSHLVQKASTQAGGPKDDPYPPGCDPANPGPQCCPNPQGANATAADNSDPVSVVNGREILTRTDLVVPGVYPIRLTRRYDSQSTYDSALGYGWAFGFDQRLFEYPDGSVEIRNSCGYRYRFIDVGGVLTPEESRQEELVDHGDGTYTLVLPRNRKAHFAADGTLSALEDPVGNQLELTWGPAADLTGTSPFAVDPTTPMVVARKPQLQTIAEVLADTTVTGRSVAFAYDANGRLDTATASDGREVKYAHDGDLTATATHGNLIEVKVPVDTAGQEAPIVESYDYQDGADDHNLTHIQLGEGTEIWINQFDANDRVEVQTRRHRVLEFDYAIPLQTVVTRRIRNDQGIETGTAVTTYTYDTRGYLETRTDALGNRFEYVRDANGFLDLLHVYHNDQGSLVLQKTVDYSYSPSGNLTSRATTLAGTGETVTESFDYEQHWLKWRQLASDLPGAQVFRTDYTFYYDGNGRPTNVKEIKRNGGTEVTLLEYDTNGQLWKVTPPEVTPADGLQIVRAYFLSGPSVGLLDEIYLQDNTGRLAHLERSFAYDARGFPATVTDARSKTTTLTWDDLGRLTTVENAAQERTEFTFSGPNETTDYGSNEAPPPGFLLTGIEVGSTATEGQLRRLRWDAESRLAFVERKDDLGAWATFLTHTYDSDDNRLKTTDATGREVEFIYDGLSRLKSVEDDAGNTTLFTYDATGNRTSVVDAKNRPTLFGYDELDRLVLVDQQAEGIETEFRYDAAGNVTRVIDGEDQETIYAYDAASRLDTVTQPLGQVVDHAYDPRGRLTEVTNARLNVLRYFYEPWGGLRDVERLTDAADPTPDFLVTYTYDFAGNLETVTETPEGGSATPLYTYTYDDLNRVDVATAHYLPGGDRTLDAGYDPFGNRNALTFTDGATAFPHTWTFDDLDRLTTATLAGANPLDFTEYFANDDLKTLVHANGVTTALTYLSEGPVETITVTAAAQLHKLAYDVGATLNVDWIDETWGAGSTPDHRLDYAYDGVDRLTEALLPATGLTDEAYQYDKAGNRDDDPTTGAWTYDANNRIQTSPGTTWAFDADGNLETKNAGQPDEERFSFDHVNRLVGWEKDVVGSLASTASYRYDPFGRRIQKVVDPDGPGGIPPETTWFLWDGDLLLAEFDGSGARTRRYTYAGGFAPAQVADPAGGGGETVYEVHTDYLDTPRMLTDASGAAVWQAGYQAYGEADITLGSSLGFQVRFPGQYYDEETGLHYNRFRYYDVAAGRFVGADPLGQARSANVYWYASGSPINRVDPLGLFDIFTGFGDLAADLLLGEGSPRVPHTDPSTFDDDRDNLGSAADFAEKGAGGRASCDLEWHSCRTESAACGFVDPSPQDCDQQRRDCIRRVQGSRPTSPDYEGDAAAAAESGSRNAVDKYSRGRAKKVE